MPVRDDDRRTVDVTPPTGPVEAPERIGPYRLLEKLGEGGMGVVYLAEQKEPVWRRVAVKIVKLGMDTSEIVARFETERQALAMMDHPGIAKVLDAGATETGRPYFVMELVRGQTITAYCDDRNLATSDRLKLFLQVCDAVQHAHQKGVIHRDLKPGNILISDQSGEAMAKIIDFGVAKALDHRLTQHTLFTQHGQLIGTPEYMSPEQAAATGEDIDTRSDVYSLGVVFYELLTGALPFDPTSLREAAIGEMRRIISEETPPKPSTRLSTLGDESGAIARRRRTSPHGLERELRGDLDWIALKAMEKETGRRYATASEFAADIRRHLSCEPVAAGPPSAWYVLSKFARRHRGLSLGVVAVAMALSLGLIGTTWQASEAKLERAQTAREARTAQATLEFLRGMLADDLEAAESGEGTLQDRLDAASDAAGRELSGEPAVESGVRLILADAYISLGLFDEAQAHVALANPMTRGAFGAQSAEMAECLRVEGEIASNLGELDRAAEAYEEAIRIWRMLPEHALEVARCTSNLGLVREKQGLLDEAEALYREALLFNDPDAGDVALRQTLLARLLQERGEFEEAEELLRDSLETMRSFYGAGDVRLAPALDRLARLLQLTDRLDEAVVLSRESVEIRRNAFEGEYPVLASSLVGLAIIENKLENHDRAIALLIEARDLYLTTLDADHPYVASTIMTLAVVQEGAGDLDEALATHEDALARYRSSLDEHHWMIANARSQYGGCLLKLGRTQEAERELLAAFETLDALGMSTRAQTAARRLAELYEQTGNFEAAQTWRSSSGKD